MEVTELRTLLERLLSEGRECEWLEFKLNFHSAEEIGETLSALSNGACVKNQSYGYMVFGISDTSFLVEGTSFRPKTHKHKKDELVHWLLQRLNPRLDVGIYEFDYKGKNIVIFKIPATFNQPVEFMHEAYIRIGSIIRKLRDFPEFARKIWSKPVDRLFEKGIALDRLDAETVDNLLDTHCYFELMGLPYPSTRKAVIERFVKERFIVKNKDTEGHFDITNLGAILLAKDLGEFPSLPRESLRVIVYQGKGKLKTLKDQPEIKGYAVAFERVVDYINAQLPQNEEISKALRETVRMYPVEAIRELVANAIIHQDFKEKGTPFIEIYSDRIEFSNPGLPMIRPERFIDEYKSRNEELAGIMRRLGICEEKGSGIDRLITSCEVYQLPAPNFLIQERHTKAVIYAHKPFNEMDRKDRIRACYQHCCLRYVTNEKMTNQTLRKRFKIEPRNSASASRIIKDTVAENLIKEDDPNGKSKKYASYIPFWA
ncbi:MAG: putative DNA binding domain-containing protein [Nitrospirae bacterium]|nr:putative DNA binding domain-containing protein [Nitrospirota bacterium]